MTTTAPETTTRMRSQDRRVLILDAASEVFGERGYHGATTDQIARVAGVSQPYVVRMFGGKEALFLAVLDRSLDRILGAFRAAVEENRATDDAGDPEALARCIGRNYVDLLSDRGLLLSLMHAFLLGSDPAIGPRARAGFRQVYAFLREEIGISAEAAHQFLSHGMLLHTVVGLRMADDYDSDPSVRELLVEMLPTKLELLLHLRDTTS